MHPTPILHSYIMSQASEVYTRLLLSNHLGFPLWNPAPDDNLVSDYREKGVSIGDVGLITSDGKFDFLFNICLPSDHPVNQQYGVPKDFEVLSQAIQITKDPMHYPLGASFANSSRKNEAVETSVTLEDNPYVIFNIFMACANLKVASAIFLSELVQDLTSSFPLRKELFL